VQPHLEYDPLNTFYPAMHMRERNKASGFGHAPARGTFLRIEMD